MRLTGGLSGTLFRFKSLGELRPGAGHSTADTRGQKIAGLSFCSRYIRAGPDARHEAGTLSKPWVLSAASPSPRPETSTVIAPCDQQGVWAACKGICHSALSRVMILTGTPSRDSICFWHKKQMVSFFLLLRNSDNVAATGLTLFPPHMHMLPHTHSMICYRHESRKHEQERQGTLRSL